MPAILASDIDAERWRNLQADFFVEAGLDFRPFTLPRLRDRFRQRNIIATVDTHGICEVKVGAREARVELLLPRGQSRTLLFPVLLEAFEETARRYPAGLDWRVWAAFMAGKDADSKPDGGEGECYAWQEFFPDSEVLSREGGFWIESTLQRLLGRHV